VLDDLSGSQLLTCLVDDAHWLDPESAQVLAFVARRLRNERILMVFAARDQPEASTFSGIPELAVQALGLEDAVEVLLSAAGDIPLDRQVARDIAARAEGNPLALIEVGRELAAWRARRRRCSTNRSRSGTGFAGTMMRRSAASRKKRAICSCWQQPT
jgi:hypothetical protein